MKESEIKTYSDRSQGVTKVFFTVRDGVVTSILAGNNAVPTGQGYQFYVDDYVAEQIHKCELYLDGLTPKLRLKEGEELVVPQKTEKELEIERLKYELERLQNEDDNAE